VKYHAHAFIDPSWSILKAEFEIGVHEQDEVRTGSGSDRVKTFAKTSISKQGANPSRVGELFMSHPDPGAAPASP